MSGLTFAAVEHVWIGGNHRAQPKEFEFGERQCTAEDPSGHRWTFSKTLADVALRRVGRVTLSGARVRVGVTP
jgi:hypothetical protein